MSGCGLVLHCGNASADAAMTYLLFALHKDATRTVPLNCSAKVLILLVKYVKPLAANRSAAARATKKKEEESKASDGTGFGKPGISVNLVTKTCDFPEKRIFFQPNCFPLWRCKNVAAIALFENIEAKPEFAFWFAAFAIKRFVTIFECLQSVILH